VSNPLLVERAGHVETWTLNLPASRNPITGDEMIDALVAAAQRVDRDRTVRAVILTGGGSAFSTGGNIKDMADRAGMFGGGTAHDLRAAYRDRIQRIPRAFHACEVPLIAAVNGPALGAGFDLAMMCDLRLATPSAFFAESFVKLGVIPGDGGTWFLPRVVGAARAAEMALTGDRVDAETALAWGLVSRVVPAGQLLAEARALADRIAVNPPQAVRMAKKLLRDSQLQSLDATLELAAAMQVIAHQTDDHAEAVAAFMERRDPRFTGR
jgi:enoyl-CoA hydratase/carnithine racemase